MSKVLLTRTARRDLDTIWDYVAKDSAARADRLLNWRRSKFKKLADQPLMAAKWDPDGDMRAFSAKGYTIFYKPRSDGAEIRRVIAPGLDPDTLDLN